MSQGMAGGPWPYSHVGNVHSGAEGYQSQLRLHFCLMRALRMKVDQLALMADARTPCVMRCAKPILDEDHFLAM